MAINKIGYDNREQLISEIKLRLADGIVDVELDREHYDVLSIRQWLSIDNLALML